MKFNNHEDDDRKRDWFDGPDVEETPQPKPPRHTPEEPEYYYSEEPQWEHLRPRRQYRFWIILFCAAVVVAIVAALYTRYFTPYTTDATQYGYIESVEQRGTLFKTWEGVLIPYKELMDTTRVYNEDFLFSAASHSVGKQLKQFQLERKPVRVQYKVYHTAVPWRGETEIVVTAADTVAPDKILPPEFTPRYYRERDDLCDTADISARRRLLEESEEDE